MTITRSHLSGLAATGGGTSLAVTWSTNPAAGAKVLVAVLADSTPTSVADNGTSPSTFTADAGPAGTSNLAFIYRADAITLPASGSYTVTIDVSSTQTITAAGIAYLGVRAGSPSASSTGAASDNGPVSTGNATPYYAGALFFAAFADDLASGTDTITLTNASFTGQFTETDATDYITGGVADWIDSGGPSAADCTWTINSSAVGWAGVIAAYDAAGSSPSGSGLLMAGFP